MEDLLISVVIFIILLVAVIAVRLRVGGTFEIKNSEILIALIPVALWLVLTGKIQKLEFGDFKIESAFIEASGAAVKEQVTPVKLPIESISVNPKVGVNEIPRLIRNKTESLLFRLGHGRYYGPAIKEYLDKLNQYSFFKYVIVTEDNGRFFGIMDSRELDSLFESSREMDESKFARYLNRNNMSALSKIPGLITAEYAIGTNIDKKTALEAMEQLDTPMLPVVDDSGQFAGIVDRSRLTASLIIDVANKVDGDSGESKKKK